MKKKNNHLLKIIIKIQDYSRWFLIREYLRNRNKKNAVFIWIPKTAGTSFCSIMEAKKLKNLHYVKYRFPNKGPVTFGHMDYSALVKNRYVSEKFDRSAIKFGFCRNPYDRAVSLFNYLKKIGIVAVDTSFLAFCRNLAEHGCEKIGPYNVSGMTICNPQVRWVENVNMDYVGKYESLADDAATILNLLGLPPVSLPHLNRSNSVDYRSCYCEESIQIVREFYKEDFGSFGYLP